ncbi:helix-turn-helix transcriptional regulator [Streptomyces polyrhachis]|uniref:Helix-turn-helix transcriptional regulator n=1 Tax=Streptomyces polyrhachis TaxID=1282885 RepID=A0ABW2GL65_9ACTN
MAPVFAHGRLRLYLLGLLNEAPRHGYEVIRLLEERFQGLYAPSAGTVYPRLAKLEAEGLVTHTSEGGRKVYSLTGAGREELAARQDELAELELEIRESVAELAADIRADVSGSARDLRREMRQAAKEARGGAAKGSGAPYTEREVWRVAKDELRRAKQEWKEQVRRAKEDARAESQEEMQRIARRVQEQVQTHVRSGDWQGALREGMAEFSREMGSFTGRRAGHPAPEGPKAPEGPEVPEAARTPEAAQAAAPVDLPGWAKEGAAPDSPADRIRELERLLDRFRDDVRDAARDHGVSAGQLREARRHVSTAAAHVVALLKTPGQR